ncbi:unnamed protein product [Brachionus calyciflorus]|uniref:VWFA domain-containing protein n=1 Tax=Brachionus calyciflorus TaxID=104777 RepID=A0A813N443_9BILA|nr:unnamed protein product [Brachionus calyciflorus]
MSNNLPYPTQYQQFNASAPQPYEQPPSYQPQQVYNQNESREQKFRNIINKYEISQFFADKLQKLNMFKIVFVFDDSGSMNATLSDSPLNTGLLKATRWDELQYFAKISIEIANVFNENGTDVYFLNRPMARSVCNSEQLIPYFQNKPSGYTPLAKCLNHVLSSNSEGNLGERKLLVIIVTDGEPTDDYDEDETMDYLNNWDRVIPRLDVVDDYRNERKEILQAQRRGFSFSFGDYVVKSLIGSIDESLDRIDEINSQGCCVIL